MRNAHNYGQTNDIPQVDPHALRYRNAFRINHGRRQPLQKQPSYRVIENTPHSELLFYDIYLSTLHEGINGQNQDDHSSHFYSHAMNLKRRKSRKVQQMTRSKSRDLYADIVIVFNFRHSSTLKDPLAKAELERQTLSAYEDILGKLRNVGLQYETRPGGLETILIFVLCPWNVLKREVVRNSIQDWLKGVKIADTTEAEQLLKPAKHRDNSLDDLTDSDRIRLIYELITELPSEGGAGIFPDEDSFVQSVLPLHDWEFNKAWLKSWSTRWIVSQKELSRIRDHFGEKVVYYFEFLEFYFLWLIFPTVLGILVHFFGSSFSIFYSISVILWAVVFIEAWKRREKELALLWGVRNVRKSETRRQTFQGDRMVVDPVTDEQVPFFSPWKRLARKMVGLPVILGGAFALSILVTLMFVVEVFLEMYYGGHMKEVLVYLPTVLFTLAMPYVEGFFNGIAEMLTDFENHETNASHDYHLVQKIFIFKVLNSYLAILLTAYVYIPFGPHVIAILQTYGLPFATVAIEPKMLQDRLQAFMISNQVISFFSETIYPWIVRKARKGAVKIQKEVTEALRQGEHEEEKEDDGFAAQDPVEVKQFIKNVQSQVDLPVYDVNEDFAEMVEQFGYVTLFSVVWPLTSLCAFINNWIELRSDAAKICFHTRRPLPSRTESIGPWINNLEHLTWFASLTNASILYLFRGAVTHHHHHHKVDGTTHDFLTSDVGSRLSLSVLLVCLFASEHVYLGLRWAVKMVLDGIPTPAELSMRRKDYGIKRSWLSRLNDAIGGTFDAVVGLGSDGAATTTALGGESTSKVSMDGCIDGVYGLADVNRPLETDLGAQAIRSMFKTG
ncbi:hypothetical protein BGZ65_005518 [Modicella reniformis]|uniref:Uncharacterized protein n=1 Tax=Modicella reniformis TaxID=1440133 RepID=A0A9P6JLW2_9FUNG|nr:hypothetical protein BGZ65_005518 [Modicella reniformis]